MMTSSTDKTFLPFRVILFQSPNVTKINDQILSLEVFEATEFNEIFSGRQQRQDVKVLDFPGTNSVLIFRMCWLFGSTSTP